MFDVLKQAIFTGLGLASPKTSVRKKSEISLLLYDHSIGPGRTFYGSGDVCP